MISGVDRVKHRLVGADAAAGSGAFLTGEFRGAVLVVGAREAQSDGAVFWRGQADCGDARVLLHALEHLGFFFGPNGKIDFQGCSSGNYWVVLYYQNCFVI